jgi:hypothetical protein
MRRKGRISVSNRRYKKCSSLKSPTFSVFIDRFFTDLSLRLRARSQPMRESNTSKKSIPVTVSERRRFLLSLKLQPSRSRLTCNKIYTLKNKFVAKYKCLKVIMEIIDVKLVCVSVYKSVSYLKKAQLS